LLHFKEVTVYSAFVDSLHNFPGVEKIELPVVRKVFDFTAERFKQMAEFTSKA